VAHHLTLDDIPGSECFCDRFDSYRHPWALKRGPCLPCAAHFRQDRRWYAVAGRHHSHTWLKVKIAREERDVCSGSLANLPGLTHLSAAQVPLTQNVILPDLSNRNACGCLPRWNGWGIRSSHYLFRFCLEHLVSPSSSWRPRSSPR